MLKNITTTTTMTLKKFILTVTVLLSFHTMLLAEGTKELTPVELENAALYIWPSRTWGPYFNAGADDQLRFFIKDHTTEDFYFGTQFRTRGSATILNDVYYRILDNSNTVVAGPALVPVTGAGVINNYNEAVAGPQIGALNPAGYDPIIFDPTSNGEYHIEFYRSTTGGASMTSTTGYISSLFDFTIANASGTTFPGRLYCQAWSILATTASDNYQGQFVQPINPTFFAYTPDSTVVNVEFTQFNPLAAIIGFNFFGVDASITDWTVGRQSNTPGTQGPNLVGGYSTFLNLPDSTVFPFSTAYGPPTINSDITGCPGNYQIDYTTPADGDVFINLEFNGTAGFQAGTADRQLLAQNAPAGNATLNWDGLDGLGNAVPIGGTITISTILRRGRINLPIYDAEWNINGFTINTVKPVAKSGETLFWDDSQLTNTGTSGNSANGTGAGIDNSVLGQASPGRAWNGAYGSTLVTPPAPANGGGNATPTSAFDDFGNIRTLNTWFFGFDTMSAEVSIGLSNCAPLPVEHIELRLQKNDISDLLLLETKGEENIAFFELEYSLNGIAFKKLDRIDAQGNTATEMTTYRFNAPKRDENVYYRIRVSDIDGSQYLSNTVLSKANLEVGTTPTVFPNPIQEDIHIHFNQAAYYIMQLYDMNGRMVMNKNYQVNSDYENYLLSRANLKNGLYILTIKNENTNEKVQIRISLQ